MYLEIGKPFPAFVGVPESTRVQIDDSGIAIFVFMRHPEPQEIADYEMRAEFQFGIYKSNGVLLFVFKPGSQAWCDAPYNPCIGPTPRIYNIPDGTGIMLSLVLVDTATGTPVVLRILGLPTRISRLIMQDLAEMLETNLPLDIYATRVFTIQRAYNSEQLAKLATTCNFTEKDHPKRTPSSRSVKPYPGELPGDLLPYHVYLPDCGHSIMCIPEQFRSEKTRDNYMVPVAVKWILAHTYTIEDGYVYADVPYSPFIGVSIDDSYYEY